MKPVLTKVQVERQPGESEKLDQEGRHCLSIHLLSLVSSTEPDRKGKTKKKERMKRRDKDIPLSRLRPSAGRERTNPSCCHLLLFFFLGLRESLLISNWEVCRPLSSLFGCLSKNTARRQWKRIQRNTRARAKVKQQTDVKERRHGESIEVTIEEDVWLWSEIAREVYSSFFRLCFLVGVFIFSGFLFLSFFPRKECLFSSGLIASFSCTYTSSSSSLRLSWCSTRDNDRREESCGS